MVVKIQIDVFWVVTLCSVVVGNQGFRRYAASIFRSKMVLWNVDLLLQTVHGITTQKTLTWTC